MDTGRRKEKNYLKFRHLLKLTPTNGEKKFSPVEEYLPSCFRLSFYRFMFHEDIAL